MTPSRQLPFAHAIIQKTGVTPLRISQHSETSENGITGAFLSILNYSAENLPQQIGSLEFWVE